MEVVLGFVLFVFMFGVAFAASSWLTIVFLDWLLWRDSLI